MPLPHLDNDNAPWWVFIILNVLGLGGIIYRHRLKTYQHRLMWRDYLRKHNMDDNGGSRGK